MAPGSAGLGVPSEETHPANRRGEFRGGSSVPRSASSLEALTSTVDLYRVRGPVSADHSGQRFVGSERAFVAPRWTHLAS